MRVIFLITILSSTPLLAAPPATAPSGEFPLGVVVGSTASGTPTRQQQQFHLNWVARSGLNIVETEFLGIAGGWVGWGGAEPEPGKYVWQHYDDLVADAENAGVQVVLHAPTWRSAPAWIYQRHPDAHMLTPLGGGDELSPVVNDQKLDIPAHASIAHPAVREGSLHYAREIARRFRDRPTVRGYFIGDEYGLNNIYPAANYYGLDFSPAMLAEFHAHLKQKYQTIEKLNDAWRHLRRYRDFSEITWKRGWAHDAKNYRGEWLDYYRFLERQFADFHNAVARAIHEEDPNAVVMVSGFEMISGRIGHGAYLPLMRDIDAIAYKSYWHDNRFYADWCGGILGPDKQVWISNLSERETTTGPAEQQRYMDRAYIQRQLFPAIARGLDGVFMFVWSPILPEATQKMNLLKPAADGVSVQTIEAVAAASELSEFMRQWYSELCQFAPEAPGVAVHDNNLAQIASFWNYGDPNPQRVQSIHNVPLVERYMGFMNVMVESNRRFAVSSDERLEETLNQPGLKVWSLTGGDYLDEAVIARAKKWVADGGALVLDDQSGMFSPLGEKIDAFGDVRSKPNVLVLHRDAWQKDADQVRSLSAFLDRHVPLSYRVSSPADAVTHERVTVDRMRREDGAELAVIARRGAGGHVEDALEIELQWQRPHERLTLLDPFAGPAKRQTEVSVNTGDKAVVTLAGYQDVVLVLAR